MNGSLTSSTSHLLSELVAIREKKKEHSLVDNKKKCCYKNAYVLLSLNYLYFMKMFNGIRMMDQKTQLGFPKIMTSFR